MVQKCQHCGQAFVLSLFMPECEAFSLSNLELSGVFIMIFNQNKSLNRAIIIQEKIDENYK